MNETPKNIVKAYIAALERRIKAAKELPPLFAGTK